MKLMTSSVTFVIEHLKSFKEKHTASKQILGLSESYCTFYSQVGIHLITRILIQVEKLVNILHFLVEVATSNTK